MSWLRHDVPLAGLTTLEVGGPARHLAVCQTPAELDEALAFANSRRLPMFILGGGSNVLVADSGFDGLVLQLANDAFDLEPHGDEVLVRAGAGLDWDLFVERVVAEGLGGLECLSGIPGRVGAAPIQNVGAYGQEIAETLHDVEILDLHDGTRRTISAADCGFAYRISHFKGGWRGRYAVLAARFRLPRRHMGEVRYADLERRLGKREGGPAPSLQEVRSAVLEIRRGKSMVLSPGDPNRRSAGSFFLNPIVSRGAVKDVRRRLGVQADDMPAWPAGDERVKLSAAWLIERCGFPRGFTLGRAAISSRHSLALVNRGGARAAELVALAARVRQGVRASSGVTLHPEPNFLGFEEDIETLLDRDILAS